MQVAFGKDPIFPKSKSFCNIGTFIFGELKCRLVTIIQFCCKVGTYFIF